MIEPLYQFLEHKHEPGNRRIEGRGQASASTSRQQHAGVGPAELTDARRRNRDAGAHLDGRPLTAQRQPGADCQESSEEFYRYQRERSRWNLLAKDGFDMRNAAARSMGRELPHHPGSNQGRDGARTDDNQESPDCVAVGPGDRGVAQAIGTHEQKPEDRPHASSGRSDEQSRPREAQQAATFANHLSMIVLMVRGWFVGHSGAFDDL
jgi:hypothetical protein